MNFKEFLRGIFSNPEGTEDYILENRSRMKSFYMCLIAGFLLVWNALVFQFRGEHYSIFGLVLLMYLSFYAAGKLTMKILPQKVTESKILKLIIIAIEIAFISYGFNYLTIVLNISGLFFILFAVAVLLFGELYIAFKEIFFDFYWLAFRKTEHADKRSELSRITSWYVLATALVFQVIFFPLSLIFIEWHQVGVGIMIYGFLMILWMVWCASLCTYILDKQIKDNHLKNSAVAWSSVLLGIGHLVVFGELIAFLLQ
ncbi:MAG: hypothetical protein ACFFD2_18700 [Promethearchaeota archaeon]